MSSPLQDAIPLGEVRRVLVTKLRHHGDVLLASVPVGPLAAGKSFDSSQPIFLKAMTARELRAALKLP